jgi:phospholipid/cholesterol/gamma-HCH transport system substrate-binding protein
MLKVSNETKVGILTVIAIALLVLGFNLLKGKSLFSSDKTIYAVYKQVNGLQPSNFVQVNGLKVGSVSDLNIMDHNAGRILVTLRINKDIQIPRNSVARITSDLLGMKTVQIDFGNSNEHLNNKDTIYAAIDGSITDALKEQLSPLVKKLEVTLSAVDSVLLTVNAIFDTTTKGNLRSAVAHLNHTMNSFSRSANSLSGMMDPNKGNVHATFDNLASITENLKNNNDKITAILSNAEKTTGALANGKLDSSLLDLQSTVANLNDMMAKLNSTDGSLGLLMNDRQVYNNLQTSLGSLNKLLEDLRVNPKRYVHFSLFGRKDKVRPVPSDTVTAQR